MDHSAGFALEIIFKYLIDSYLVTGLVDAVFKSLRDCPSRSFLKCFGGVKI